MLWIRSFSWLGCDCSERGEGSRASKQCTGWLCSTSLLYASPLGLSSSALLSSSSQLSLPLLLVSLSLLLSSSPLLDAMSCRAYDLMPPLVYTEKWVWCCCQAGPVAVLLLQGGLAGVSSLSLLLLLIRRLLQLLLVTRGSIGLC